MNDKYTRVTYESGPIGRDRITLYLTTFDLEAFENDERLEKIPTQRKAIFFEFDRAEILNNPNLAEEMNKRFEYLFNKIYREQLEDMKNIIEMNRKIEPRWIGDK